MNTPNVHAGRLERRVRQVGRDTMPDINVFCSFYPFGAITRSTAIVPYELRCPDVLTQDLTPFFHGTRKHQAAPWRGCDGTDG